MKKIEFFTARYCGKCRALKRRLIDLKDSLTDVEIVFRDIDIERDLAKIQKIDGVPTLVYYLDSQEIGRISGSIYAEDILKLVDKEIS
ncbi:MAG: thioredoxin family protein [Candidatus Izemoplasmatales bacterium]|nr:thioredoxin family protein [Candidatus Izemoplasmatales bacterium]